jgi:serine/threonine protein kinase
MAPELIDGNRSYDSSVDVFAFAVLVYAMFAKSTNLSTLLDNGAKPTSTAALWRNIAQGARYRRLDDIPVESWALITQCWSPKPGHRPTFHKIVSMMTWSVDSFLFPGANESEVRAYAESICPPHVRTVRQHPCSRKVTAAERSASARVPVASFRGTKTGDTLGTKYEKIEHLGCGGCSSVYSANQCNSDLKVAIKHLLQKDTISEKRALREVECHKKFRTTPGCLPLLEVVPIGNELFIVTPLMANGDLARCLAREFQKEAPANWATAESKMVFRIAQTMSLFHRAKWVHRDLKPQNIFIDENWEAVIGDFGLARSLVHFSVSGCEESPTLEAGTAPYLAPELSDGDGRYDSSVDVFAFGVLVYAMFAKTLNLFTLLDNNAVVNQPAALIRYLAAGVRYKRPDDISNESPYWRLITQCWSQDPSNRPPFEEIVTRMTTDVGSFLFPGANEAEVRAYAESLR